VTVSVGEFWRVGRRADPLRADVRYQGAGRFDDPERLVPMLYGSPLLRTCLLEFMLPWAPGSEASAILARIPQPTSEDETIDADRDRRIAAEPRHVPTSLYERIAIHVRAEPMLTLLDLRDVAVRESLAGAGAIAQELHARGFAQLDRGALLSPHRPLTQAVVGAVVRGTLFPRVDGLFVESRHAGDVIVVFADEPFAPRLAIVASEPLTPSSREVITAASELGLFP